MIPVREQEKAAHRTPAHTREAAEAAVHSTIPALRAEAAARRTTPALRKGAAVAEAVRSTTPGRQVKVAGMRLRNLPREAAAR